MEEEEEQKEVNNLQQGTSEGQHMLTKSVGTINSVLRPFEVYVPMMWAVNIEDLDTKIILMALFFPSCYI